MSDQSNLPMTPAQPGAFYDVWLKALTRPSEQTYADLANAPDASPGKAYLWVFLASLISFIISAVIQGVFLLAGDQTSDAGSTVLISLICAVPVLAGLSVLGLMIGAGLVNLVAGMFKGAGTFAQLVYVFGAISAPVTLISAVLSIFYAIPFLGLCLWPLSILLLAYTLLLEVMAVKGVHRFGWGEAIGSVFILPVVLGVVCGCLGIISLMAMGPAIGDVFSQINQSLQGVP